MLNVTRAALAAGLMLFAAPAVAQDDGGSYGAVIAATRTAWIEPEDSTATDDEIATKATYFVGNIAWLTIHEFGHALVSEYGLPILGREEDSVDNFATINMIADDDDPGLDEMVSDVIDAWFTAGLYANLTHGEHSVDEQRAYAVVCLLVGKDPIAWKDVADYAEMPQQRQEGCKWTYQQAEASWQGVLVDHELAEDEAPTAEIAIVYDDPGEFAAAGALLQASGVLEQIAGDIERKFRLSAPLTVSVETCGQANAFFVPNERKVKICYELALFFLQKAQELTDTDEAVDADDSGDATEADAAVDKSGTDEETAAE